MAEAYICEECRESISEEASVCPHCGYDPGSEMKSQAKWRLGVGALLCFTVVGAILGIPLGISGFRHYSRAENATPAVPA